MENKEKIIKLLNAIKLEVDNIEGFENDINSILGMFDEIKNIDIPEIEATLNRKKIEISDLREDIRPSSTEGFRPEMKGKYFRVPNVSKKSK